MTKYWNSGGESPLRRYAACGPPYQVSPERHRYPPEGLRRSNRSYAQPLQEFQLPDSDQDSERESKESRRRIPVACGRCRKRKIRCSGPQNDASCVNCKNAGNAECQFNRVSSEEVAFKSSVDFGYNTELARAVHVRGSSQANSYRPPTPSYNYGSSAMPTNLSIPYRTHPTSDYPYEVKSACSLPPFNVDYHDEGLDYALSGSAYPGYAHEVVGGLSNYSSYGSSRVWCPATPQARNSVNGIYFGSNVAAYSPSQTNFNSQAYGLRSSVSNELNNFSFTDMTSSLPTSESNSVNTRTLPMPPTRNNSVLAPLHRLANELNYNSSAMNPVSGQPLAGTQLMTSGHLATSNYSPSLGSGDSVDDYNCNGLTGSLSQQQHDLYSNSDSWTLAPLTTDPALRSHNSSSNPYYGHCNDDGRKPSQSGQSSANGTLITSQNSSPDLYSYTSDEHSRKTSQSEQSSQSSVNSAITNGPRSSTDLYYSHCDDTSREASQSGQVSATSAHMASQSYQVQYTQEKSLAPRSSSIASMDIARTVRHHSSTGNLHATL